MEIKVGRFFLRSDQYGLWVEEEYTSQGKGGRPGKTQTKKVAGYSRTLAQLYDSFVKHNFRASEATTVKELLKDLKQIEEDLSEIRKTALKEDFKMARNTAKKIKAINEEKGEQL